MYDAIYVADRETNNIIAHHPPELQDRFYTARQNLRAASDKTHRMVNIVSAAEVILLFLPLAVCGSVAIFLGGDHAAAPILVILGMIGSAALTVAGVHGRIERRMRRWEWDTMDPFEKEYREAENAVYAYQRDVVGEGF